MERSTLGMISTGKISTGQDRIGGGSVTSEETRSDTRAPVAGLRWRPGVAQRPLGTPRNLTQASTVSSKAMIVGMALMAAGGLISLCGVVVSSTALATAVRRWLLSQQEPPSAIVKRKIAQAKAATAAGANAWQNELATQARPQ